MAESAAVVEQLLIRIGADIVDLKKGVNDAVKNLENLDTSTKKMAQGMTASFVGLVRSVVPVVAIIAAATAAFRAFQNSINITTQLDQLSQSTGISIQRLSELRGIAILTGTDFETLARAASQFGARMTEALAQPASRGSQAIRALGVDVRDARGNIQSLDQLLPSLADAFSKYADGSNKAALASALFGEEAGPKLIPLLNRGRAGLEELRRAVGSTTTPEDAQRVREYQKTIGELQLSFERLVQELVRTFGPTLIAMANAISVALAGMNREASNVQLEVVGRNAAIAATELAKLKAELAALNTKLLDGTITEGSFARATTELNAKIAEQETIVNGATAALDRLRIAQGMLASGPQKTAPGQVQAQAPIMDPHAIERAQFALDQLMERMTGTRMLLDEMNFAWATHADRVAAALEKVDAVHASGFQRERARAQIQTQLAKQEQQQILDTASLAASTITALWPKSKGAAIASAIINTAVGITNALSKGSPPWNWAQAALIAATGAAQIAAIRSTSESGGGSSPSTGGGEAAGAVAEGASTQGRTLSIQGVDPAAIFSGRQLEDLIRSINEEVQNGATLISTRNIAA